MEEARLDLEKRREEWRSAVNDGEIDAYTALVTHDLVWFPPTGSPIEGRQSFREWLEPFFERYDYEFNVEPSEVRPFEGWCVEAGRFTSQMIMKGGAVPQKHSGSYLVIWRREEDGKWRIERYLDGFGSRSGNSEQETSA